MDLPLEFPSNAIKSFSLALFNLLNDLYFFNSLSFKIGPTPWRSSIPIRVQADLLVGSIKADLEKFSGIANPLEIVIKN